MSKDCDWMTGRCCCGCKFQGVISKHPWNDKPFKGAMTEVIAYTCNSFGIKNAQLHTFKHGECEEWSPIKPNER